MGWAEEANPTAQAVKRGEIPRHQHAQFRFISDAEWRDICRAVLRTHGPAFMRVPQPVFTAPVSSVSSPTLIARAKGYLSRMFSRKV